MTNDALVRDFLAAWERRDSDYIIDRFTDDAIYHAVPLTPIVGKPAIEAFVLGRSHQTAPRIVIHQQIAENNFVVNERTDHMTLNGRPVTLQICAVFEIDNGHIKAWREYFDLGPAAAAYKGD